MRTTGRCTFLGNTTRKLTPVRKKGREAKERTGMMKGELCRRVSQIFVGSGKVVVAPLGVVRACG